MYIMGNCSRSAGECFAIYYYYNHVIMYSIDDEDDKQKKRKETTYRVCRYRFVCDECLYLTSLFAYTGT